jgi:hypothetical protein
VRHFERIHFGGALEFVHRQPAERIKLARPRKVGLQNLACGGAQLAEFELDSPQEPVDARLRREAVCPRSLAQDPSSRVCLQYAVLVV